MGQWVRCTLESDEKQGEQKLVRHSRCVDARRGPVTLRRDIRFWHQADVQPIASRRLVPGEKGTCLISVWNVRF
jgi:hypothetical protein